MIFKRLLHGIWDEALFLKWLLWECPVIPNYETIEAFRKARNEWEAKGKMRGYISHDRQRVDREAKDV